MYASEAHKKLIYLRYCDHRHSHFAFFSLCSLFVVVIFNFYFSFQFSQMAPIIIVYTVFGSVEKVLALIASVFKIISFMHLLLKIYIFFQLNTAKRNDSGAVVNV